MIQCYARYLFEDMLQSDLRGNEFTVSGASVVYADGKYNKGVSLTDYYRLDLAGADVFLNSDFTITMWFKAASTGLSKYPYYRRIVWAKASAYRGIEINSSGKVAVVMDGRTVSSSKAYNDNTWHFLTWKHEGITHTVILDSVEVVTNTCENTFGELLYLSHVDYSLNGQVDDLYLFNAVLTDEDVYTVRDGQYAEYITRYLLQDGAGVTYTVTDGALTALEIAELTGQYILDNGFADEPDWTLLQGLVNPSILCWHDGVIAPGLTVKVTAIPPDQVVISELYDMSHPTITGIEGAAVDADDATQFSVSFDGGKNWRAWNGEEWVIVDAGGGMTKTAIEAVTMEQWTMVQTSLKYKIRAVLTEGSAVRSIVIDYANREASDI